MDSSIASSEGARNTLESLSSRSVASHRHGFYTATAGLLHQRSAALPATALGSLAKFRATAGSIGVGNAMLLAVSRALEALFGARVRIVKYYFTAQAVVPPKAPPGYRIGAFRFAWVDADHPLLARCGRPRDVIVARFAQGARCLMAADEAADFAGFLWFVVGPYEEDEVRARFAPTPEGLAAWDFDVSIQPRYRMGRLFGHLWSLASAELADRGVKQTVSRISAFNALSLASHRRLGARIVGEAVFFCVGPLQLMNSSLSPRWHLSWSEAQRPLLEVDAGG